MVTSENGGYSYSVTSRAATVTVRPGNIITTQPASITLAEGYPSGSSLSLSTGSVTPTRQWYSSTTNSNSSGTAIGGATGATYNIPTGLTLGTYYYYCVVNLAGVIETSNVATVTVTSATGSVTATIANGKPLATSQTEIQNLLNTECSGGTVRSTSIYGDNTIVSSNAAKTSSG